MSLDPWGGRWGARWGGRWGTAVTPPPPPPSEVTPAGWNAYVREAQKKKRRQLAIPEHEELVHPIEPESIYADDPEPAEVLSAEKFAELMTHGLRRPLYQAKANRAHDEDEEDTELLLLTI